jgi:anti-sigma factor RsiW
MHEEICTLLNAYLDGELHGQRLREMETHLASCAACRNDLNELRMVSDLLQADSTPEFTPADRFVSQLNLSLPRRTLRDRSPKPGTLAWWFVPAGLLGAWFFVQTVFTLTDVVTAANMTGLLGHVSGWLVGGGQESIWFSTATSLFGRQAAGAQPTLSLLNNVSVFSANLLSGFLWQAVIVLLYWVWLFFFWWLRRGPRPMKMGNVS